MRIGRTADFSCFRSRKSQCEAAWFAISSEILQLFSSNGFRQSISPIKLFFLSRDRANREDAKNYLQSLSQRLDIHGPKTRREKQLKVANRAKKTTKINSPMTYFWNRRLSKPNFVRFLLMFGLHVQKHRVLRIPDSKNNNGSDPITKKNLFLARVLRWKQAAGSHKWKVFRADYERSTLAFNSRVSLVTDARAKRAVHKKPRNAE